MKSHNQIAHNDLEACCLFLCLAAQSGPTLCNPMDCSPPGSSIQGDSTGKNTGVGCHALLQGIFPTQGLNPCLLNCRQILYQWAIWEAHQLKRKKIQDLFLKQIFIWLQQVLVEALGIFDLHWGMWVEFSDQELNPGPLCWECRVLVTEPLRKSLQFFFFFFSWMLPCVRVYAVDAEMKKTYNVLMELTVLIGRGVGWQKKVGKM